ncbi:hypothetical protein [Paenibacillus montanisoli]|uniref:hypothetical protein n=1 Tax=Paenibacillus montanisoli TaxID=2081970 RepID=UPI001057D9D5|nr:hypothetical protein [Paenibacillus montanisoli]
MIRKFFITWCILLIYCGFVLGIIVEFVTTEDANNRISTGVSVLPLLIVPSIVVYVASRSKNKK